MCLEFCNQHYRDEFPRTSSDEFPRTSRVVRFDGRKTFLSRDEIDHYLTVFVHRDSGFTQIVLNFFLTLIGVHRVHGCEKYGPPVRFETFSSQSQTTLDDGMHVVSVPDVVHVIGEVIRQQYIVLQCWINESTS